MVGPSLLVLVVVLVVTWALTSPGTDGEDDDPYVAPLAPNGAASADATGAAQTLQDLVRALRERDREAATALAAPDDPEAAELLGALVDTAAAADVTDIALRYIDEDGGVAADGSWSATVDVTWAYAGFDRRPSHTETSLRFRPTGAGEVDVAGLGDGPGRVPVWMSGPTRVSRTDDLLVVAAVGTDLDAYVRLAEQAVPTVTSVVTTWRPRLVVEVPADGAALEKALGTEPGYYAQIAAVTGSGGEIEPGGPIHVFVNPDVFSGLGRAGREVVLAHEATHVATDAPSSLGPTWLTEGFADYVALRETTLPLTRTAGQAAQQVLTDGLPDALPDADEFDTRDSHLGAVYEESWLICVTLGERGGPQALEGFYTSVSEGTPLAEALRRDYDWSEDDLLQAWQDRLAALPTPS